jgi:cytochrome P450
MKQLDDLPYLEAVINESLRILPPVPYTLRRSQVAMDMLGIPVQPGDWIVLSHFISHRCPKLYPEPRRFLPQRWFCIKPNQYEFLPFSAGPRWCIGKSLAMNMMKLTLAMIMQRFRWQVRPGARIDRLVRVTMSARRGLPMVLEPQDRRFRAVHITGNVANLVDWTDANNSVLARAG